MQFKTLSLSIFWGLMSPLAWTQESMVDAPVVGKHVASNNLDVVSMLLSLCAVLALIVVAASLLKKFQLGPVANKDLKVVTSLNLSAKERLVVVEVDKKQLLLGVTAHNISVLKELETPLKSAQPFPADLTGSLTKILKKQ
ncbi:flagellar biosynthetic protein FliO [Thalassotalea sp. M1531]|uniref:Flagellar protein n=1 Tax=Thalassotalea algicola TaxID=2716224 RepID=A0A7Y0LGR7_9GAMM|nr:flagellar biosynthetic protein FliO [Thalassotalea algicola]NMP32920.1 flagellar biosynthetic protein FliO [Thalassotalea algicola]